MYVCMYVSMYVYVYIYIERERESHLLGLKSTGTTKHAACIHDLDMQAACHEHFIVPTRVPFSLFQYETRRDTRERKHVTSTSKPYLYNTTMSANPKRA